LQLSVRGPRRIPYDAQSLGAIRSYVTLRVQNPGARAVLVPDLHPRFRAVRQGVPFPCNSPAGEGRDAHEAAQLGPGDSVALERALDCSFLLPGLYDVSVRVHRTVAGQALESASDDVDAGSFEVEVTASGGNVPQPVPGRDGLYAILTGPSTAPPLATDVASDQKYRAVLALINGADHAVALGAEELTILVFRRGSALPCLAPVHHREDPSQLAPGEAHIEQVSFACAPTLEGQYEVVGRLSIERGAAVEIGRIGLTVTPTPYFLFTPGWPPSSPR
jgi:hypothetical protein